MIFDRQMRKNECLSSYGQCVVPTWHIGTLEVGRTEQCNQMLAVDGVGLEASNVQIARSGPADEA